MSNDADRPAKRGEARWKEVREGVAKSNEEARRVQAAVREDFERVRMRALGRSGRVPRGE